MNTLKKNMLRRAEACALSLMLLAAMTGCAVSEPDRCGEYGKYRNRFRRKIVCDDLRLQRSGR